MKNAIAYLAPRRLALLALMLTAAKRLLIVAFAAIVAIPIAVVFGLKLLSFWYEERQWLRSNVR